MQQLRRPLLHRPLHLRLASSMSPFVSTPAASPVYATAEHL
jgi:hypothetical protein